MWSGGIKMYQKDIRVKIIVNITVLYSFHIAQVYVITLGALMLLEWKFCWTLKCVCHQKSCKRSLLSLHFHKLSLARFNCTLNKYEDSHCVDCLYLCDYKTEMTKIKNFQVFLNFQILNSNNIKKIRIKLSIFGEKGTLIIEIPDKFPNEKI